MRKWADVCAEWLAAGEAYRYTTGRALEGLHCFYCDEPAQSLDHIVARANGGPDTPDNLVPVCRVCNGQKSAKSLEAWAEQIRADLARMPRKRRQLAAIGQLLRVDVLPDISSADDAELDAALERVA